MKVLPVKRISRDTETSSALERQDIELREAVAVGGHELVHMVEDATVSGAVNLDERPSLGEWLTEPRVHEWEALMVTTQDRITRDDMHWWQFVGWVLKHNKSVIVLDDPSLDLTTEDGRMIAGIKATQAAKYRKTVQEKKLKQTAYYREVNLWSGGVWPFGYRTEAIMFNGSKRLRLVKDEHTAGLIREAYESIVDLGSNMNRICIDWNARGILTATDYQKSENAKANKQEANTKPRGVRWQPSILKTVLSSPTLMGYATHKGSIIREDGLPVQRSEPILTRSEFDRLQEAMATYRSAGRRPHYPPTVLSGLLFCICGLPLYSNSSRRKLADGSFREYRYYLCAARFADQMCPYRVSWDREYLKESLESYFLESVGDLEIMNRAFIPGRDRTAEITELEGAIENLAQAIAAAESSIAVTALTSAMERHAKNLETLRALPVVPSSWSEVGTGVTYREKWNAQDDWNAKAELLRRGGFKLVCGGTPAAPSLHFQMPANIERRLDLHAIDYRPQIELRDGIPYDRGSGKPLTAQLESEEQSGE
jgi:site-specific DNA recombinase